ncbi:hypothetical protein QBC43DRAFT_335053 [Cladorrhinum sp. PSN259]|nr:hypothetical protein QBC43DRAFT_335053 [Cladorrhinum sp. PSN259]
MQNDTHLRLGQLYDTCLALLDDIAAVEKLCTTNREVSDRWARNLRFLCVPLEEEVAADDQIPVVLRLSEPGEFPQADNYVAVSYCWNGTAQPPHPERPGIIVILTRDGQRSPFAPHSVLWRALKFAQTHGIQLIWIDQECIIQHDTEDQFLGINSMDLVYANSRYPLGILTCPVETQAALSLLAEICHGQHTPRGRAEIFQHVLSVIRNHGVNYTISVLGSLMTDSWFTRTWIFQEWGISKDRMIQLIPHHPHLQKRSDLGILWGEAEIDFDVIRAIPIALIATSKSEPLTQASKAFFAHFRALFGFRSDYDIDPFQTWDKMERVTAANAIPQIERRDNSIVSDRLAIIANLVRYQRRIAIDPGSEEKYGLSICMITLALINGDIDVFNDKYHLPSSPETITSKGVWYYPNNTELLSKTMPQFFLDWDNLNPAWNNPAGGRPYYPGIRIHREGLQLKGWVWRAEYMLPLHEITQRYIHLMKATQSLTDLSKMTSAYKTDLRNLFWDLVTYCYRTGLRRLAQACLRTLGVITTKRIHNLDYSWTGSDCTGKPIHVGTCTGRFHMSEAIIFRMFCCSSREGKERYRKLLFPALEVADKHAPWLLRFAENIIRSGGVWVGHLEGEAEPSALFDCEAPCTIFLTSQVVVENLGITEPLALLNVHCLEVVDVGPQETLRFLYAGRRLHGMWNSAEEDMKTVMFPYTSVESTPVELSV